MARAAKAVFLGVLQVGLSLKAASVKPLCNARKTLKLLAKLAVSPDVLSRGGKGSSQSSSEQNQHVSGPCHVYIGPAGKQERVGNI